MKFNEIKEKLLRNKFTIPFECTENSIQATIKTPTFDTNFIISIDYFDDDQDEFVVNYKRTKTGKTYTVHYVYLNNFMDDYEIFLDFLSVMGDLERDYNHVFGIIKETCIE